MTDDQPNLGVALKPEQTADLITKAINDLNPSMGEVRVSIPAMRLALERFAYSLRAPTDAGGAVEAEDIALMTCFANNHGTLEDWGAWCRIRAALTSEPKAEGATGWLIESDMNGPIYHRAGGDVTRNAAGGLRFSRREDAEAFIRAYGPNHYDSVLAPAWKAVEHRWG